MRYQKYLLQEPHARLLWELELDVYWKKLKGIKERLLICLSYEIIFPELFFDSRKQRNPGKSISLQLI